MARNGGFLYKKIEEHIIAMVKNGKLAQGSPLPTERELGERFKASRIPVRQALQKLEGLGLVERIQGKGTFLRTSSATNTKTSRLGILYTFSDLDFFISPTHAMLLAGIDAGAKNTGKDLLLRSLEGVSDIEQSILSMVRQVDGLILVDTTHSKYAAVEKALHLSSKPVVVLFYEGHSPRLDYVHADSRGDTRKVVEFLIGQGHTRIGCVYNIEHWDTAIRPGIDHRIKAYRETMIDHGLAAGNNLLLRLDENATVDALRTYLAQPGAPTAVFCTMSLLARHLYRLAAQAGVRIPDDLTVVGYDDNQEYEMSTPPLTTIKLPLHEMGVAAVHRLMERQGVVPGTGTSRTITLPGELVLRGSHRVK